MQVVAQDIRGNPVAVGEVLGKYMARYFMEPQNREEYYAWAKSKGIEVPKQKAEGG